MKNAEVENCHYWSGLVGQAGRLKNGRMHLKLILCCLWAIISPHAKFHPNWIENTEVKEIFTIGQFLVGLAGRSENWRSHLKLILCCF